MIEVQRCTMTNGRPERIGLPQREPCRDAYEYCELLLRQGWRTYTRRRDLEAGLDPGCQMWQVERAPLRAVNGQIPPGPYGPPLNSVRIAIYGIRIIEPDEIPYGPYGTEP